MEADDIILSLKAGHRAPVYLFHGEEPYFIDQLAGYMQEHVLTETEQVFNLRIFYGKDTDFRTVVDEACQYPLMAGHRMILIREAQDMKTIFELETYLDKPVPSSILVICYKYKKLDQRTKMAKSIKQHGVVFESKKLYDNQLPGWIQSESVKKGLKLQPEAAHLIAEYLGSDLGAIQQDLEKIRISTPANAVITAKDLESIIGIHKDFNVFELQKSIGQRDLRKTFQIIQYFKDNPKANPLPVTMASLYNFLSKLYVAKSSEPKNDQALLAALQLKSSFFLKEYKEALKHYSLGQVEQALLLLREYDLKSKGVNYNGGLESGLLKEMVSRLMM
ncbi:MAG: DNA polymerase III subunit delta [Saprospiraceae bacterium]|nr:DNA polymerase III subunit delta [Saprospiraceae bacterium]